MQLLKRFFMTYPSSTAYILLSKCVAFPFHSPDSFSGDAFQNFPKFIAADSYILLLLYRD
jgi:hypothetical protein